MLTAANLSGSRNKGGPAQKKEMRTATAAGEPGKGGSGAALGPRREGGGENADVVAALVKPFPDNHGLKIPRPQFTTTKVADSF